MNIFNVLKKTLPIACGLLISFISISSMASVAQNNLPAEFTGYNPDSTLKFNFQPVDSLLDASVLDLGPSDRSKAKRAPTTIGTRLRSHVNVSTDNEGNRLTFEHLDTEDKLEKVLAIKQYLETIPTETPLNLYNKHEQLAYWLNLYNTTIIYEIAKLYPRVRLESLLDSDDSLLDKKLININGIELSLNDIHYKILFQHYNQDPLVIYGLYQGAISGPDINKQAFTGNNVYKLLTKNATYFVNSNRGVSLHGDDVAEVSNYYARNSAFFPDFDRDLKVHLIQYANNKTKATILSASSFEPSITNWKITDFYGSERQFGTGVATSPAAAMSFNLASSANPINLSGAKFRRIKELLRVRARNLGSSSVTITELESEEN